MKKIVPFLLVLILALGYVGCSEDDGPTTVVPTNPIAANWISKNADVAPLLRAFFPKLESLTANFKADRTYSVLQKDSSGTTITYTGTYLEEKSTTGSIYKITINQSTPSTLTSQGIFEVKGDTLRYEIVQTTGTTNVPPTPEKGFGSSNNGALGVANVQVYKRVK